MLELVDLMYEDRQVVRSDKFRKMEITERSMRGERDDDRSKNRRLCMKKMDQ